jgi:hypothetical protein
MEAPDAMTTQPLDPPTSWDQMRAYLAPPPDADADAPEGDAEDEEGDAPKGKGKGGKGDTEDEPTGDDAPTVKLPDALDRVFHGRLVERVASYRTPGGLVPLILAVIFLLFAVVPADSHGNTRLFLFWRALTGGAHLPLSAAGVARQGEIAQANSDNAATASALQNLGQVGQVLWNIEQFAANPWPDTISGAEAIAENLWHVGPDRAVQDIERKIQAARGSGQ